MSLKSRFKHLPKWGKKETAQFSERRPYRVAQIELTSRCSTNCIFCPHSPLGEQWIEGDLPLEVYRNYIAPYLHQFELVYLQGWGEPMLHPHLFEMLELSQQQGCKTGFTTNGLRLQAYQAQRLLDMGVDLISISLAGAVASTHESLRRNAAWKQLIPHIEGLVRLKQQGGYTLPWLEMHFLMMQNNLKELPDFVRLAASLGADEVVATNLTYSPSMDLDRLCVFHPKSAENTEQDNGYRSVIAEAHAAANNQGIPIRVYPLEMEPETLICDANPLETIFINHLGEVTPCVYLGLSIQKEIPRVFLGHPHPTPIQTFGNIRDGLPQALNSPAREEFTKAFIDRNINAHPLSSFSFLMGQTSADDLPPPPPACQHCYKMFGV